MSPLVWDLGHIAAYEDLWLVHRHGGEPLLHGDLAALYDAFETPRAVRGDIEFLRGDDAARVPRRRSASARWPCRRARPRRRLLEMVLRHELQHNETMRQALFLGGLLPAAPRARAPSAATGAARWIEVPPGPFEMGAGRDGFAYDNERPRHARRRRAPSDRPPPGHQRDLAALRRGRRLRAPRVVVATRAGRGRRSTTSRTTRATADRTPPDAPVLHVSWFEADAFARSHGARLPTEAEWEKAATWTRTSRTSGAVWEWTSTPFGGYPGFVAHPYREYSEVFFGDAYRVLRGGSWATHPRVASTTFRNWDLPQRRQIFAGVDSRMKTAMKRHPSIVVAPRARDERTLADDVLDGLTRPLKELPPKHFYDARGSRAVRPRSASCPSTTRRAPSA